MTSEHKTTDEGLDHVSYLLRLWRERGAASTWWRASLHDPLSGQLVGFANLEALFHYLRQKTGEQPEKDVDEGSSVVQRG